MSKKHDHQAKGQEAELAAIVVVADDGAIGRNGDLLCHLPADLKHFKSITMGHSIIMGRRTFDSFPKGAVVIEIALYVASVGMFMSPNHKRKRKSHPMRFFCPSAIFKYLGEKRGTKWAKTANMSMRNND